MYTIIFKDNTVAISQWYEYENNWNEELMLMIIHGIQYSTDGLNWINMQIDHL